MLQTVYLLVRIIFLMTLSDAMGTALPVQSQEPRLWGWLLILWNRANILSFNKTAENLSWGRQKRGRWRQFWLAEALWLWSWAAQEIKRAKWSCARCYCPLGERLGIISPRSGRWLLQLQHQRTLSFYPPTRKLVRSKRSHGFPSSPY